MVGYNELRAEQAASCASRGGTSASASRATSRRAASRRRRWSAQLGAQAGLYESATVRVHPTGKVSVFTGSHQHGQGHETTFAQIVADRAWHLAWMTSRSCTATPGACSSGWGRTAAAAARWAERRSSHEPRQDRREEQAHRRAHARGGARGHRVHGRPFHVRGSPDRSKAFADISLAAYLAHSMPAGIEPGLEATCSSTRRTSRTRSARTSPMVEVDAGHGAGQAAALHRRGRRRQRHQPDDRGRAAARRDRAGRGAGAVGGRRVRRRARSSSPARS